MQSSVKRLLLTQHKKFNKVADGSICSIDTVGKCVGVVTSISHHKISDGQLSSNSGVEPAITW